MRCFAIALAVVVLLTSVGFAQPAGTGLGIILGEPTGLSAKFWLTGNTAFDAAAAWSVYRYTPLHVHADVLYHNSELLKVAPGVLPAYVGMGGRVRFAGKAENQEDVRIGVRVPLGLEYLFAAVPVGLFVEAAPIVDLLPGTEFEINGAAGARWYFR